MMTTMTVIEEEKEEEEDIFAPANSNAMLRFKETMFYGDFAQAIKNAQRDLRKYDPFTAHIAIAL